MRRHRMNLLFLLLRPPLGSWLRWRFRLSIHVHGTPEQVRPPLLVLSNHVNFWDPFLLAMAFRQPVHFLAADGNFRGSLMRGLMRAAGAIPKAKARTDMESLRDLRERVSAGEIVALFPEGQRTWDGVSRRMLPATPKLARLLGATVVVVQLRGAYLSTPRWARNLRRGRLEMHVQPIISAAELRRMHRSEIERRLTQALHFDEGRWQEETGRIFTARHRATHAEQALFWCPACGSWDCLRSSENTLACQRCNYTVWFAASGRLYATAASRLPRVFRLRDWNALQLRELEVGLATQATGLPTGPPAADAAPGAAPVQAASAGATPLPLRIGRLAYLTGYRSRALRDRGEVELELSPHGLRLTPGPQFSIASISGINVQFAHQLEFYAAGRLHVLRSIAQHDSVYRVEQTILALQDLYNGSQH